MRCCVSDCCLRPQSCNITKLTLDLSIVLLWLNLVVLVILTLKIFLISWGNVFDCDVDPSDYVSSEDELSNEAIESYKDLQAVLGKYDDSGKRIISGTAKQLFYTKFYMRAYCHFFIEYLHRVLFYVNDSLTNGEEGIIEDLKDGSIWFNLYDGTPRKMDTRLFRKALRDIDVVFNETIKKVTKRNLKQEEAIKRYSFI